MGAQGRSTHGPTGDRFEAERGTGRHWRLDATGDDETTRLRGLCASARSIVATRKALVEWACEATPHQAGQFGSPNRAGSSTRRGAWPRLTFLNGMGSGGYEWSPSLLLLTLFVKRCPHLIDSPPSGSWVYRLTTGCAQTRLERLVCTGALALEKRFWRRVCKLHLFKFS